ncbi:hypothetical protein REPUB_Repub08aG0042200 [Reevesia pubescens]
MVARFDVQKMEWKLVSSPNSLPPSSAHQAVAWKNYLYIFGGEFTSPNQKRFHYYKEFWMLDLKTNQWEQLNLKGCPSPWSDHRMWQEIKPKLGSNLGSMWPSAWSGFQFFGDQDQVLVSGIPKRVKDHSDSIGKLLYITSDVKEVAGKSFDYNVVGRGTAGCPLAATLSEEFSVLLIEGGGSSYDNPLVFDKRFYGFSLIQTDEFSSVSQDFKSTDGAKN